MKKITRFYKKIIFNLKNKINLDNQNINYDSLNDLFNHFGTDKGTKVMNPYSKNPEEIVGHGYAKFYEKNFANIKNEKFNLLEIGTWEGASSASFILYFPNAEIYGLDRNFKFKYKSKRLKYYNCDLTNKNDHKNLERKIQNKTFKIIIDDGSHILSHIIENLKFFLKYVDDQSYYIIEDFSEPVNYDYLNDSNENELFIKDILLNIKNKSYFKSKILTESDQKHLFDNIASVDIYKGDSYKSDIAFLKKK